MGQAIGEGVHSTLYKTVISGHLLETQERISTFLWKALTSDA
jgi:hypothetical protein